MKIQTYSYTNVGSRKNNEDSLYCGNNAWVVADGLGGHECGEVASRIAVDTVRVRERNLFDLSDNVLLSIVDEANAQILAQQSASPSQADMRTTFVAGFAVGNQFRYIHVGDSRLYYFRKNRIYRQTRDHSVSFTVAAMGEISYADVRKHDDRNKLLKVLGNGQNLGLKQIDPAVTMLPMDAFLLCSDGFWEYVYEAEMEMDLAKSASPEQWMRFMLKRLLLRYTGDNDNFTAICGMMI